MKRKTSLITGLILGIIIGWAIGYLRIPIIKNNNLFWVGFSTASALIILVFLLNKTVTNTFQTTSKKSFLKYFTIVILSIVLITSFYILQENVSFKSRLEKKNFEIEHQSNLIKIAKNNNLIFLKNRIFERIEEELKHNQNGILSTEVISRIAAVTHEIEPYQNFEKDSSSVVKTSPERSQILLSLISMNIDKSSLHKIYKLASFEYADLSNKVLTGYNFEQINLRGANLLSTVLDSATLNQADLRDVNLRGASLKKAMLKKANLRRADMSWAEMDGVNLEGGMLDGVRLVATKIRQSYIKKASIKWANLENVHLNKSNLSETDLNGSNLSKANLSKANLNYACIKNNNLTETNLMDVKLEGAVVKKGLFQKLKEQNTLGAREIKKNYIIILDKSKRYQYGKYCLKAK